MFDHLGFNVADFEKSKTFYVAALAPLGIHVVNEGTGWAMLGKDGKGQLWIGAFGVAPKGIHLAFVASNRQLVRDFYEAALNAGGKNNGAPGLRPQYHANYYGAFVIDPDGHNVEAVCHVEE